MQYSVVATYESTFVYVARALYSRIINVQVLHVYQQTYFFREGGGIKNPQLHYGTCSCTKIQKKSPYRRSQSFTELLANQRRDRGEASRRSTDRRGMSLAVSPVKLID